MNEFWFTMIFMACLIALGFGACGIISFVDWYIDKKDKKKWDAVVAAYPEILDYQKQANMQWEAYNKKSNEANGYKEQIDELISSLYYMPSYEVERYKEKAEEYKVLYFEARSKADEMYQLYLEARSKIKDYCEQHKLRRCF